MSLFLSSFKKTQITFEIRYDEAFLLWDRTGSLFHSLSSHFKDIRSHTASPNQTIFYGDRRFVLSVGLERASITDHLPDQKNDKTFEIFEAFVSNVTLQLELQSLKRIGTRFLYTIDCKDLSVAHEKMKNFLLLSYPSGPLFNVSAHTIKPTYKIEVDNDDLGYIAQLYVSERKFDFNPSPEIASFDIEVPNKKLVQLVLDLDFITKKPMLIESFDALTWLKGWQKAIGRDADKFLSARFSDV